MRIIFFLLAALFSVSSVHAIVLPNAAWNEKERTEQFLRKAVPSQLHQRWSDADVHVQFASRTEAAQWAQQVLPRLQASAGAQKFTVLSPQDPRGDILQAYVHDLWSTFVRLYPNETAGLGEPPVILIDSEVANAFVPAYLLQPDKIAHAVIVLTALIDTAGGLDKKPAFTGMFAHELAHSVFKHLVSPYREHVNRFYWKSPGLFGFQAARDPALDQAMGQWASSALFAGDLTNVELLNLPSMGLGRPITQRVWTQFMQESGDNSLVCVAAKNTGDLWSGLQKASALTQSYNIADADLPQVAFRGGRLIEEQKQCLNGRKQKFIDLLSKVLGVPASILDAAPDFQKMAQNFDSAPDMVTGLRKVVLPFRITMLNTELAVDFSKVGNFSREEHADEVSVIVHRAMNADPLALNTLFAKLLPPDDLKKCDALLAAGEEPPMGAFSDEHRATCYRMFHLQKFNTHITDQNSPIESFAEFHRKESLEK